MIKLFRLLRSYRLFIVLILLFTFLQTVTQLALPTIMARIVDVGIVNENVPFIIQTGVLMLIIAIAGVVLSISGSYYTAKVSAGFGEKVRNKVFSKVENFSLQEFNHFGTSSLITRTTNDIMQVQQFLTMMLKVLIIAPMLFIGALIIAVWIDPVLSLFLFAPLPIIIVTIIIISKKGIPLFNLLKQKTDQLNLRLREGLTGIRVIRSFNRTNDELQRFQETNSSFSNTAIKVNRLMIHFTPIMMLVFNFSIIAIIGFGAIRVNDGNVQIGELMAFIQYATQIMFSLTLASVMVVALPRAAVSAGRINEVLDMASAIKEPTQPIPNHYGKGNLEFRHVTFQYPGAEKPVLSDISFSANAGEVTAIIGGTGAGKSTLASLVPRFYDVSNGNILIDGIDIRNYSLEKLRGQIGWVPQQAKLFKGNVIDNIRYGNHKASDQEVERASSLAQAAPFISQLENEYHSAVAQNGANFSGGQRQRLAIARALVRQAKIYFFDDSFSASDFKTSTELRSTLQEELKDETVIMISQRVSSIMDADQIIVLNDGQIAGIGKHHELMETCVEYREIVRSQFSEGAS